MSRLRSKQSLLVLLVFSQFAGTSLWFVGNAVLGSLPGVSQESYASLTAAVQGGFIAGTLLFSLFGIADRFSSSLTFFFSCLVAAAANVVLLWKHDDYPMLLLLRFLTGLFLAGVYPVGMKIAADFFPDRLGKALGFLVGALVLGTAFPHLVRSSGDALNWRTIIIAASILATIGGFVVVLFFRKQEQKKTPQKPRLQNAFAAFRSVPFRSAAVGYFGHMWELYALWAVLPVLFSLYNKTHQASMPVYLLSFGVIAAGSLGCAVGGLLAQKFGSKPVAFYSLLLSGCCCLLSPLFFQLSEAGFLLLLFVWGLTVTADSPQFSALVARFAVAENRGTSLSLVTCIGFSVTIFSIYLLKFLFERFGAPSLWMLSLGPFVGLVALKNPKDAEQTRSNR